MKIVNARQIFNILLRQGYIYDRNYVCDYILGMKDVLIHMDGEDVYKIDRTEIFGFTNNLEWVCETETKQGFFVSESHLRHKIGEWLDMFSENAEYIKKIRRRVEESLRHSDGAKILSIAKMMGVKISI